MLELHGKLGVSYIKLWALALLILKNSLKAWRRGRDWRQSSSPKLPTNCSASAPKCPSRAGCFGDVQKSVRGTGEARKKDYSLGTILQGMRAPEGSQHCLQLHLPSWLKALRN